MLVDRGIPGAELDAQLSRDGVPVVVHDFNLKRTTGLAARVRDVELSAIRELDAGGWFAPEFRGQKVPLLEEVLARFGRRLYFDVELKWDRRKGNGLEERVIELIRRHGLEDRCLLSSFNPFCILRARRLAPELPTAHIWSNTPELPFILRHGEAALLAPGPLAKPEGARIRAWNAALLRLLGSRLRGLGRGGPGGGPPPPAPGRARPHLQRPGQAERACFPPPHPDCPPRPSRARAEARAGSGSGLMPERLPGILPAWRNPSWGRCRPGALPFLQNGVSQIAQVVEDLDRTVEQYWKRFGVGPWDFWTYQKPLLSHQSYHGKPSDYCIRIALCWMGPTRVELIQPVRGPSVHEDFVRAHGYGVQHLGVLVTDCAGRAASRPGRRGSRCSWTAAASGWTATGIMPTWTRSRCWASPSSSSSGRSAASRPRRCTPSERRPRKAELAHSVSYSIIWPACR